MENKLVSYKILSWIVVVLSALFIPFFFSVMYNIANSFSGFLALATFFIIVSFLIFKKFHIPFNLKNILILDITFICLLLMPGYTLVEMRQTWFSALAILIALAISLFIHLFFRDRLNKKIKTVLVTILVISLACYNTLGVLQIMQQRRAGETLVKASYVYTKTNKLDPDAESIASFSVKSGYLYSRKDLESYYKIYRIPYELNQEHDGRASFQQVMRQYDDAFFSNYLLKITAVSEDSSSIRYQAEDCRFVSSPNLSILDGFTGSSSSFLLKYRKYYPPVLSENKLNCLIIVELPKSKFKNDSYHFNPRAELTAEIPVSYDFISQFDAANKIDADEYKNN